MSLTYTLAGENENEKVLKFRAVQDFFAKKKKLI